MLGLFTRTSTAWPLPGRFILRTFFDCFDYERLIILEASWLGQSRWPCVLAHRVMFVQCVNHFYACIHAHAILDLGRICL